jgi:hypothetical protein
MHPSLRHATRVPAALALAALLLGGARPLLAQRQVPVAIVRPVPSGDRPAPAFPRTAARAGLAGLGGAVLGVLAGVAVDTYRCEQRVTAEEEQNAFIFHPCFLYSADGSRTGMAIGTVLGSTRSAIRAAGKHGCPEHRARPRALGGALLGAAPGILLLAHPHRRWPSSGTLMVAMPLMSGVGAVATTRTCRGPG